MGCCHPTCRRTRGNCSPQCLRCAFGAAAATAGGSLRACSTSQRHQRGDQRGAQQLRVEPGSKRAACAGGGDRRVACFAPRRLIRVGSDHCSSEPEVSSVTQASGAVSGPRTRPAFHCGARQCPAEPRDQAHCVFRSRLSKP
eukprot:355553-Chlamydomonas_euryale.AAC.1